MNLNIVIIGAGEVGFNLSKALSSENHDITVVDIDSKKCDRIKNNIDAKVIHGDGASQRILQQIDMKQVHYMLALTKSDEVNLIVSLISNKLGAKKVICRLRNTEFTHKDTIFNPIEYGINSIVFPELAARNEIEGLIRQSSAMEVKGFMNDEIKLVGIHIEQSSPLLKRTIQDVKIAYPFISHTVCMITRNDNSFIPTKHTDYNKDDLVYFIGKSEDISNIQKMAGKPLFIVKNIMILGAGKIGRLLAKSLQYDFDVRIIEQDSEKAKLFSQKLDESLMLIGDGLDVEFLESENLSEIDCFIAVTENEQTNILAGLLAKQFGVKQIILHINTSSYLKAVRRIGFDAIVSKNISAVDEILKMIKTDLIDLVVSSFEEIDLDAVEVRVNEKSKYFRNNYSIKDIPQYFCLSAIRRQDTHIIPNAKTEIEIGDDLLIFTNPENIEKVHDLFT